MHKPLLLLASLSFSQHLFCVVQIAYRHAWHDMSTRQVAIAYLQKVANKQKVS